MSVPYASWRGMALCRRVPEWVDLEGIRVAHRSDPVASPHLQILASFISKHFRVSVCMRLSMREQSLRSVQALLAVRARAYAPQDGWCATCRTRTSEDLAIRALRRRRVFASRQAVLDSYGSRPPFKSFQRDALASYIDHGFTDLPGGRLFLCSPSQLVRLGLFAVCCCAELHAGTSFCCSISSRASNSAMPSSRQIQLDGGRLSTSLAESHCTGNLKLMGLGVTRQRSIVHMAMQMGGCS